MNMSWSGSGSGSNANMRPKLNNAVRCAGAGTDEGARGGKCGRQRQFEKREKLRQFELRKTKMTLT